MGNAIEVDLFHFKLLFILISQMHMTWYNEDKAVSEWVGVSGSFCTPGGQLLSPSTILNPITIVQGDFLTGPTLILLRIGQ